MEIKFLTERNIDPNKPMVALTFDDGPSSTYTPEILGVLKENDARATFFVLGAQAEQNTEILKQIIESGSEIGSHTYGHLDLTNLVDPAINYQVATTQEIIRKATGKAPGLLRPPYGFINKEVAEKIGLPIILWSMDTLDWQNKNPDVIYNTVLDKVNDGDIVLMHDLYKSTVEAVKRVIPELKRRGYQIVTVSELARVRRIPLKPGNVYSNLYPIQASHSNFLYCK